MVIRQGAHLVDEDEKDEADGEGQSPKKAVSPLAGRGAGDGPQLVGPHAFLQRNPPPVTVGSPVPTGKAVSPSS